MIKPKYYSWGTAPMKFYHIHCKLLLIGCVCNAINGLQTIFSSLSALNEFGWSVPGTAMFAYVAVVALISAALPAFAANKLKEKQWSGVLAWYAASFLPVLDSTVFGTLGLIQWLEVYGKLIGTLIIFIPTYVYYQKRSPLFSSVQKESQAPCRSEVHAENEQLVMPEFIDPPDKHPVKKNTLPTQPVLALMGAVCIVCVVSVAGNIVQWSNRQTENAELQKNVSSLKKQIEILEKARSDLSKTVDSLTNDVDTYRDRINDLEPPADVLFSQIGFVYEDSDYYHSYNCPDYPFDDHWDSFMAHNTEYCDYIGYQQCPYCWNSFAIKKR